MKFFESVVIYSQLWQLDIDDIFDDLLLVLGELLDVRLLIFRSARVDTASRHGLLRHTLGNIVIAIIDIMLYDILPLVLDLLCFVTNKQLVSYKNRDFKTVLVV